MRRVQKEGQKALEKKRDELAELLPEELPMTAKNAEFCRMYVMDKEYMGNGPKCYAAIYSGGEVTTSTYNLASELLKKENVKAEIAALEEQRLKAYEHIRYSNIETLVAIRDEMATAMAYGRDGEEISAHQNRATAIRSIETLNKMLGLNKVVETKSNGTQNNQFIFNLVPPVDEPEPMFELPEFTDAEVI